MIFIEIGKIQAEIRMDDVREVLGKNSVEDVSWLCSLSVSELDMLISLKLLVIQRAKMAGYKELAEKFNLKMLRALGFILMEYLKGKLEDKSLVLGLQDSLTSIDCNLLKYDVDNILSDEEIKEFIGAHLRKKHARRAPMFFESQRHRDGSRCLIDVHCLLVLFRFMCSFGMI
ncbi:hypothetical protein UlMin_019598 [Ulmus minor]